MSLAALLLVLGVTQGPGIAPRAPPSLARYRAFAESSAVHESWAGTGAIICGVGGGVIFGAAFYHFTERAGAVNNTTANLGGAVVGAAFGAAGGALFGSFVGSLFPKHKHATPE
jgi:hypothetical protein